MSVTVDSSQNHESKMAASTSISTELFNMLLPYNFTQSISHLSVKDVFTQKSFPLTELSENYWMDTRKCYRNHRKNSDQIFEMFAAYNDASPKQVRTKIIQYITNDKEYFAHVGYQHLKCLKLNITNWLKLMSADSVFADELMIFALSKLYQRHTVIFMSNACWTTIGKDAPITGRWLLEICDIHLLYIGVHMFAALKLKPFIPITTTAVLEPPTIVVQTPNTEDPTMLAIDLSVKQQGDIMDTSVEEQNSERDLIGINVSKEESSVGLPSTTENNATTSSTSDMDILTQPVSGIYTPEANSSSGTQSESESISDNLLSPTKLAVLNTDNNTAIYTGDSIPGLNQNECEDVIQHKGIDKDYNMMGVNTAESSEFTYTQGTNTDCPMKSASHISPDVNDNIPSVTQNDPDQPIVDANNPLITDCCNTMPSNAIITSSGTLPDFTLEKDKYKDAPLSGTFECMLTNELSLRDVLHTLGALQGGSLNENPPSSENETILMDHTYCGTLQYDHTISLPNNSDCDNSNIIIADNNVICGFSSLTINSEDIGEPIEVSMVLEDMSQNTTVTIPDTNIEQPNVSLSYPGSDNHPVSPVSLGINKDHDINDSMITKQPYEHAVLGLNQAHFSTSSSDTFTPHSDTNIPHVPGVNSTSPTISNNSNIQSSSSSEFESFHSDDIYEISSEMITSDWSSTPSIDTDSEDTVIYPSTTATEQDMANPNSSQHFYLAKQINDQYSPDIVSLWKNDAMKKKWTVPIVKLSKDNIYLLANPSPNWNNMDPYSSIEDIGNYSDKSNPDNSRFPNKSCNRTYMCTRYCKSDPVNQGIWKSQCIRKSTISYTYDDVSMSDSDYNPKPKAVKDPNIRLKGPSDSRLRAQAIIRAAKELSMAARQDNKIQPLLPVDKDRNQQCHYCGNTFYYSAGLKTHLDHAHKDILSVKGINNPQETVVVTGTNNTDLKG